MQQVDDYQEENRQALIDLKKSVDLMADKIKELNDKYVAPKDEVEVRGSVEVNTEPDIEVENLYEVTDALDMLSADITTAIVENSYKPYKEITVKNITEAIPKEVKINNLTELASYFTTLTNTIKSNKPLVNVTKQEVVFPTSPTKPISVRLSDGKAFINQLMAVVGGSGSKVDSDSLVDYQICERDDSASTKYYGYAKMKGDWYIMRESSTGSYRYAKGTTSFATNWTNRASLTYDYIYEVF